jgi:hypothetical protein
MDMTELTVSKKELTAILADAERDPDKADTRV